MSTYNPVPISYHPIYSLTYRKRSQSRFRRSTSNRLPVDSCSLPSGPKRPGFEPKAEYSSDNPHGIKRGPETRKPFGGGEYYHRPQRGEIYARLMIVYLRQSSRRKPGSETCQRPTIKHSRSRSCPTRAIKK